MAPGLSVVKLGGSLTADAVRLRTVLRGLADGAEGPAVIVPGGGPLAEAVRKAQAALAFDDALAHRLALDAMSGMARILQALEPRLTVSVDPAADLRRGRVPVWDPALLKDGHADIPECWEVTSDSLALWLAAELGAERCVLVKSAEAGDPATEGLVDAAFPRFARRFCGEIVLRGPRSERSWTPDASFRIDDAVAPRLPAHAGA
ncbi:uridylate kinase [Methylobacterium nodulans]|uniref:Aspartate/glutamate/uridylate kinase n=1 Tax=Methylobacterium nodulans (strain LMG 21967 / CNCM I-2342 / ORS 2060) TaxID=460265 RepID=B8ILG6_METNO|nr:uridylate kinase [Methylobacterium nodulans]ACL60165.1 aspartate/glutamate/uridylate kinase [Methylobacterium nodulans ORS 2060]